MNVKKTDQEIRIAVRLYRKMGTLVEDITNNEVIVISLDPRPDSVKPYVQWAHNVRYWNGFQYVKRCRLSKIHKAPGKGGCKFSNQFLLPSMRARDKFPRIRHFTGLPFDFSDIEQNRNLVCPYCFFGGPDKHAHTELGPATDLTGVAVRFASGKGLG